MSEQLENADYFILGWLNAADESQIGECKGENLDRVIRLGLVEYIDPAKTTDFDRVRVTDKGRELLKSLKP